MNVDSIFEGAKKTITEIANGIAGSEYAQRLLPTAQELQKNTISRMTQQTIQQSKNIMDIEAKAHQEASEFVARKLAMPLINVRGINDTAQKNGLIHNIAKEISGEDHVLNINNFIYQNFHEYKTFFDKKGTKTVEEFSNYVNTGAGGVKDVYQSKYNKIVENAQKVKQAAAGDAAENAKAEYASMGNFNKFKENAKTYFTDDDPKTKYTRIGTAYAAGAIGMRVMSGGTLTHDEYGRSDLVGIPFI